MTQRDLTKAVEPEPREASQITSGQILSWSFPAVSGSTLFYGDYGYSFTVGANIIGFRVDVTPTSPASADLGIYVRKGQDPTLSGGSVLSDYRYEPVGTGAKTLTVNAGTGSFISPGDYRIAIAVFSPLNQSVVGTVRLTLIEGASCAYTLTSSLGTGSRISIGAVASSGTISVNTGAGCAWNASSNASWLRLTGISGSGPGTISYTVDANTGSEREGTISLSQASITLVQAGAASTGLRAGARILTHIAAGAEWTTVIYLTNLNTILSETYSLDFYKPDGSKWALGLDGGTPVQGIGGTLSPGKSIAFTTSSSTTLGVGWAAVYGGANIAGYGIFRSVSGSGNIQEAAAPMIATPIKRYVMLYSATSDRDSGIAVVNPTTAPLAITIRFTPFTGSIAQTHILNLPPLGHTALSATNTFPWVYPSEGTMELTANSGFAVLGLKFNVKNSSFTSFEPFYPFGTAR